MSDKTIDLFKTQHGWFATDHDDRDYWDKPRTYPTGFTRHARSIDVEQMIASLNPDHIIYVIGG